MILIKKILLIFDIINFGKKLRQWPIEILIGIFIPFYTNNTILVNVNKKNIFKLE